MIELTYPSVLVEHALRTVWCSPYQDRAVIVQGARVSPTNGFNDYGYLFKVEFAMPTREHDYHVYMFGQNFPYQFSLPEMNNQWLSLSKWVSEHDILLKLYTDIGRQFPLFESYVARDYSNNLLIAVRINERIADLNVVPLYMQFQDPYHHRKDNKSARIFSNHGLRVPLRKNIGTFQNEYLKVRDRRKWDFNKLLINGVYRWDMKPNDIQEDDVIEYYNDQDMISTHRDWVSNLKYFTSTLDKKQKYLFHIRKIHKSSMDIWYRDDIEIAVLKKNVKNSDEVIIGALLHKNREDTLRMVTHQDYSIPVEYIQSLIKTFEPSPNYREWMVELTVRKSGLDRKLGNDVNHIRELYKLDDKQIIATMANNNGTVPEWSADHLESSMYTYLMRAYRSEFSSQRVVNAYGYVGIAKALANPTALINENPNGNYFNVPAGLTSSFTAYNYSRSGKLLGFENLSNVSVYFPLHEDCTYVEFIGGHAGREGIYVGTNGSGRHNLIDSFRHYSGLVDNQSGLVTKWVDITNDPTKYTFDTTTGAYTHQKDKRNDVALFITDGMHLTYEVDLNSDDGVLDFVVTYDDKGTHICPFPLGKLDLWLNGFSLVEGIDFHVNFPHVAIVSQKYVNRNVNKQKLTLRMTGFPEPNLTRIKPADVGYVNNGFISTNFRYDLHAETLSRITVGGGCFHRDAFSFDSATGEASVRPVKDGAPYSIDEIYVPLRGFMGHNPHELYRKDMDLRKRISDYLSTLIPYPARNKVPVIESKYPLYSPLISALVDSFRKDTLRITHEDYNDNLRMDKVLKPYKRFLFIDPAYLEYDDDYAVIRPYIHSSASNSFELTFLQYQFLEHVIRRFLKNNVDLTTYIKIRG